MVYREIAAYGIFGVLTTLVNIAAYWLLAHPLGISTIFSTVIAWTAAVLFAYATNRRWVFHSGARTRREILKELLAFFACRIATGVLDVALMYVFVELLGFNDLYVKTASNIIVIVGNYLASKWIIFKEEHDVSISE
jgi:putative flippase GtrA